MKLDENYRIESDSNNFILVYEIEKFNKNTKKDYMFKEESYFPKLSLALDKYMNECLKPQTEAVGVLKELTRVEDLIKTIK